MTEGQEKEDAMQEDVGVDGEHAAETAAPSKAEADTEGGSEAASSKVDHEALAKEHYDRYLRAVADFENYKKRSQKEQGELVKYANERFILEVLPVIDNFKRALSSAKETKDFDKMVEGIEMIQKQLLSTLEKFGVRPIESVHQAFDPFRHQAVGQAPIEAGSGLAENQVVAETQTGYFLNERVLRPSLVIVAKKPPATEGEEAQGEHENNEGESRGA